MGHGGEIDQSSLNLLQVVFRPWAVRRDHLILEKGSMRVLLRALSPISPRHETAPPSGLNASQAEMGSKGRERTSRAVHLRWVLPAAMAGVSFRSRCASSLPPRSRGCMSAIRNEA